MSFNPKVGELKKILAKDVNKKTLQKIAKKANAKTAIPCFFKHNFKFADGKEGPLLIAGKIKQFKAEIKDLKTVDEFYGLVYVKTAADGSNTTVWSPIRGKFHTKTTLFGKTLKAAFTKAWENFEIGAETDETAAAAAEAAADSLEDVEIADDAADAPSSEAAPTAETKTEDTKAETKTEDTKAETKEVPKAGGGKVEKFQSDVEALEALLEAMKGNQDAAKHGELDAEFKKLVGGIKGEKK